MADDVASILRMPPGKALEFFRQKQNVPTAHWDDLWHEAHSRGFMVAGAASDALLGDFRKAVDQAIKGDLTVKDFRKEFDTIVAKHGWSYNGGPAWRSNLIYTVNTSMAHAAGRYARQTTPEAMEMFPYWEYVHNTCAHPRPQHVAWGGTILPANDPWFATHYPPNGWLCHCSVRMLSASMMRRRGLTVSERPLLNARPWRNPRTGEVIYVPEGIDPGFAYNPGQAWQQGLTPPIGSRFKAADAGAPSAPPAAPVSPAMPAVPAPPTVEPAALPAMTPQIPVPEEHRDAARQSSVLRLHADVRAAVQTDNKAAMEALRAKDRVIPDVGQMPQDLQQVLDARTNKVRMSGDSMEKQIRNHADLTEDDYRQIPALVSRPDVVVRQSARRVMLLRQAGRLLYRGAVKTTGNGAENYLLSLHRTTKAKVLRTLRHPEILSGTLDALPDDPEQ
ncbi:hypothetical protein KBX73_10090 [Acetobacter persici]|uniref:phage head morphogenesis protein n=1 Tax=Acetobacter persici TaxID=1076596 RepID=UPI0020CBE262|nr:phage minor head protein [Acetobacter persici]MCP9320114.1 hypothetical protein [Acetobacter persici]